MKIKWLGHAAFLVTAGDGTRIITDPFGKYDGLSYNPIHEAADIMLVSHKHGDHIGGKVSGNPQVFDKAGSASAKGIEIVGISSHHDASGGRQRGANIIFCFAVDGIRICHLGDLGHLLSKQQVDDIGETDILLIPVGGFYTIDAKEATDICKQINPRVVIPMHFSNAKCAFPISGVDKFLNGKSNVERLDISEKEFVKEELPATTEIVVLKYAF